jgi:hypothetical protein
VFVRDTQEKNEVDANAEDKSENARGLSQQRELGSHHASRSNNVVLLERSNRVVLEKTANAHTIAHTIQHTHRHLFFKQPKKTFWEPIKKTMTWSAFFQAMRSGVSHRAATVKGGRSAPQTANQTTTRTGTRSASTQSTATQTTGPTEKITCDQWDFMVLDVRFLLNS